MKKHLNTVKYIFIVYFLIAVCLRNEIFPASYFGNLYDQGRKLSVLSTKYFDIIFSGESEHTAFYLAGFADAVYDNISAYLEPEHKERITVVITPDVQMENGLFTLIPYSEIIILDYHINTPWNNETEYLKTVFTHELTHAVTMNIRSRGFEFISGIFGNYMSPNLTMPEFMIEGSAVSFESLDGGGRVNEPAVCEQLEQDIIEKRFKNLSQASGPYDLYPGGNIYYHYGGLFNSYLQKKYGMDKYQELWHLNGGAFPYTFPSVFKCVYGNSLFREWESFKNSFEQSFFIETNTTSLFPSNRRNKFSIRKPVLSNGKIYFCDDFDKNIKYYDLKSNKSGIILDYTGEIDVSKDGKYLLITAITLRNGVFKNITGIYDLAGKNFIDHKNRYFAVGTIEDKSIGNACFFSRTNNISNETSIIAVRSNGHLSDLVCIKDGTNGLITLLYGGESVSYSDPSQLNDNEVVFLISDGSKKKIAKINLLTMETEVFDLPFSHISSVSSYEGKILFSYNDDFTFYKLGIINGNSMILHTNRISGGIFYPMQTGNQIYYIGKYSEGDMIMKYREESDSTIISTNYTLKKWNQTDNKTAGNSSVISAASARQYNSLPYLLPHFWIPYFTVGDKLIPDSLGFYTTLIDPPFQNWITLNTTYNYIKTFENINISWNNTSFPVSFTAGFSDNLPYLATSGQYVRQTGLTFDANWEYHFIPYNNYFLFGSAASYYLWARENGQNSAYLWNEQENSLISTVYARYSTSTSKYHFFYNKGYDLTAWFDYNFNRNVYKEEFNMNIYASVLPVSLGVYAAFSPWKIFNLGSYNLFFGSNHYPAYNEYGYIPDVSNYFFKCTFETLIFNLEIQQGAWLLPIFIKRLYLTAGYRNAITDREYFHSVYSRLNLGSLLLYGAESPVLYLEGYYAINSGGWGISYNMHF